MPAPDLGGSSFSGFPGSGFESTVLIESTLKGATSSWPITSACFDHWAFLAGLPMQFRFVAKESLFKIPFLGWHLKRAGNIPVSKTNYRETVRRFQAASAFIARGISYVIYPEGGRTWGRMLPFRKGAFLLPVHAGAPIVPVTIIDAHKRLARGSALLVPGEMSMIIHETHRARNLSGRGSEDPWPSKSER